MAVRRLSRSRDSEHATRPYFDGNEGCLIVSSPPSLHYIPVLCSLASMSLGHKRFETDGQLKEPQLFLPV